MERESPIGGGKVFLVGAGPGDPGLITIKAAQAIRESDVILYDHLVNPELLAHARPGAETIYAGKRAGMPGISQQEINRIMIARARLGQTVTRLKGGDPFVFGRGGEEAEALADAGIEWHVIPGVSSGIAVAAYAGIPLTHRNHSSSVVFVSGRNAANSALSPTGVSERVLAADTIVIFMCADTIGSISRALIRAGRPDSTPIAVIRWGTYDHQEVYYGTLEDSAKLLGVDEAGHFSPAIEPPAIAIVGEVVSLREKLTWFGAAEQAVPLSALTQILEKQLLSA